MMDRDRKMPERAYLGEMMNGPMSSAMRFQGKRGERFSNPRNLRTVMGFILPPWQRGFVWTEAQCIRFMESVWSGLPLGTYTVNMTTMGDDFDGWLIDGQQRMRALERYLSDDFAVFGWRWSEVTVIDRRVFDMGIIWPYYESRSTDEAYLAAYYDVMNFGGTPHEAGAEATPKVFAYRPCASISSLRARSMACASESTRHTSVVCPSAVVTV